MSEDSKPTHFVITLDKVPNSQTSKATIDAHVEHLRALDKAGQLVLCGPFADAPSGMVIVRAKSKDDAVQIAMKDPFVVSGVRTFSVKTWLLATAENNYLG